MRAVIFVLILLVVAALIAVATGFVDIRQIRGAEAPDVSATENGISASGGQTPAFDVETGSVAIGTERANVTVPKVRVVPPDNQSNQAANQAANNAV
jgi:hypothetical protein